MLARRSIPKAVIRPLILALGAWLLLPLLNAPLRAALPSNPQKKALKARHKAERKRLKQQERAMKNVMAQHEQTSESKQRFKHDLKMQRRLFKQRQKQEMSALKTKKKSPKARPASQY